MIFPTTYQPIRPLSPCCDVDPVATAPYERPYPLPHLVFKLLSELDDCNTSDEFLCAYQRQYGLLSPDRGCTKKVVQQLHNTFHALEILGMFLDHCNKRGAYYFDCGEDFKSFKEFHTTHACPSRVRIADSDDFNDRALRDCCKFLFQKANRQFEVWLKETLPIMDGFEGTPRAFLAYYQSRYSVHLNFQDQHRLSNIYVIIRHLGLFFDLRKREGATCFNSTSSSMDFDRFIKSRHTFTSLRFSPSNRATLQLCFSKFFERINELHSTLGTWENVEWERRPFQEDYEYEKDTENVSPCTTHPIIPLGFFSEELCCASTCTLT